MYLGHILYILCCIYLFSKIKTRKRLYNNKKGKKQIKNSITEIIAQNITKKYIKKKHKDKKDIINSK